MSMPDRVTEVIRTQQLIQEGDRVVVAVSGGADSLALLYVLSSIDMEIELLPLYVDHGLRPLETEAEEQYIAGCCRALSLPFSCHKVDVYGYMELHKASLEEGARIVRYAALEQFRRDHSANLIAVGHTADDQVEEFFIRLIRGSGSKGLSGMRPRRDNIIRPLLFERKEALENYLVSLGVDWCRDSSNSDRRFLRNSIRLELLPLMKEQFNPSINKTILQHMDRLTEEDDFLERQTKAASTRVISQLSPEPAGGDRKSTRVIVDRELLLATHPAIRRRIMEKCCWQMAIRPSHQLIITLSEFLLSGKPGGELHLEDGVRAELTGAGLLLSRPLPEGQIRGSRQTAPEIRAAMIDGPGSYRNLYPERELIIKEITGEGMSLEQQEGELWVDLERVSFPMLLRSPEPGERFHPCNGSGRKKISRYLNERKIPPTDRPTYPLLVSDNRIVAVAGLQLDHYFRLSEKTRRVLSIHWKETPPS